MNWFSLFSFSRWQMNKNIYFNKLRLWWICSSHINFVISKHHYYGYQGHQRLRCSKYKPVQLVISQQPVSNGSPALQYLPPLVRWEQQGVLGNTFLHHEIYQTKAESMSIMTLHGLKAVAHLAYQWPSLTFNNWQNRNLTSQPQQSLIQYRQTVFSDDKIIGIVVNYAFDPAM